MRRGSKRHPELADEEKHRNKLTSTLQTLKSQHRKLRKGLLMHWNGNVGLGLMPCCRAYFDGALAPA